MKAADVKPIRAAVEAAQGFAHSSRLDACDVDDIDELVSPLERELSRALPNPQTLGTYLNSLLRSLRTQHHAEPVVSQLVKVMSDAEIPADL